MYWVPTPKALTFQVLFLTFVVFATVLTPVYSRVVVDNDRNSDNNNNNIDHSNDVNNINHNTNHAANSQETSIPETTSTSAPSGELSEEDSVYNVYYADLRPASDANRGDNDIDVDNGGDDDDDFEDYDEDMDLWPVLCPPNNFYSLEKDTCMTCTACPPNTYKVKSCHRFQDNFCLPFTSFHLGEDGQSNSHPTRNPSPKAGVSDNDSNDWKSVSLTLLVFTSVIFTCLVTVGAIFFYLRRRARTATVTKEILCSYSPAPSFPIVKVAEV